MITTDAWVIDAGGAAGSAGGGGPLLRPGEALQRRTVSIPDPEEHEALVEPVYGAWEANIGHALSRSPIDVCAQRGEESAILGNLGIVRVLRPGPAAAGRLTEGDLCFVLPFARRDRAGYATLVYAYDAPGTYGLMAKRTKIDSALLLPVPDTRFDLRRWVPYARYFTAWDNWRVAYRCWRTQMEDADPAEHLVFGWGGGVAFAEMELAREEGFRTAMTAGSDERLAVLGKHGITPVDRRSFPHLSAPPPPPGEPGSDDAGVRARYRASEKQFLEVVHGLSGGEGVAVFVDNIGAPLYKATVKSLARQGVLATVGWKHGMRTTSLRASECINRHLHVHTHVWRFQDSAAIRDRMEATGWIPEPGPEWSFDELPRLADDFEDGKVDSYFPVYRINDL
ncbi:hypothetical protein [Nocardiopsis coralliicola]